MRELDFSMKLEDDPLEIFRFLPLALGMPASRNQATRQPRNLAIHDSSESFKSTLGLALAEIR